MAGDEGTHEALTHSAPGSEDSTRGFTLENQALGGFEE
jgi:hypothetical protein